MNAVNFLAHPVSLVENWILAVGRGWEAHFSRYTYVARSVEDSRTHLRVPLEEVTPKWLIAQLNCLGPNEELALHSTLTQGRRVQHIPMVDFASKSNAADSVLSWAKEHLNTELRLFDSGRAYHAYGLRPVSPRRWVRLMGLLLLANSPDQAPVIDSRWIGHRLLAGYSALRWSRNTSQYVKLPAKISR